MAVTRISRSFKDISLSFEPHPVTRDLPVLINERAITRAVRNIVETIPYERFFNPIFGSEVRSSLFDLVDFTTADTIRDQILLSVQNFEPRVNNVEVLVNAQPDQNAFEVTVSYIIIGQPLPEQTFSFILEATR